MWIFGRIAFSVVLLAALYPKSGAAIQVGKYDPETGQYIVVEEAAPANAKGSAAPLSDIQAKATKQKETKPDHGSLADLEQFVGSVTPKEAKPAVKDDVSVPADTLVMSADMDSEFPIQTPEEGLAIGGPELPYPGPSNGDPAYDMPLEEASVDDISANAQNDAVSAVKQRYARKPHRDVIDSEAALLGEEPEWNGALGDADRDKEAFAEVKKNKLFNELLKSFPMFSDKELFMVLNRCVLAPEYLRRCLPFKCMQKEPPDLLNDRTREVIGSYDGKCYYREVSVVNNQSKIVECELTRAQQKTLSTEISRDIKRLVESDVLLESGSRSAAESVYESCIAHAGDSNILLKVQKKGDEEISRIRQAYRERLERIKTEEEKREVIEAIRTFKRQQKVRGTTKKKGVIDLTVPRHVPSAADMEKQLSKQFPSAPRMPPKNLEQLEQEDRALSASLDELERQEESIPDENKLPGELKKTSAIVQASLLAEKGKRSAPESMIIDRASASSSAFSLPPGEGEDSTMSEEALEDGALVKKPFTLCITTADPKGGMSAVPGQRSNILQRRLFEAFDALIRGQLSASISIYKELLQDYPKNVDVLFGLASAYHKLGQRAKARPYYQQAVELDPDRADLMNNFLALLAEESPESALIELQKLKRISPDFSPVHAQIGLIYFRMKNYVAAAKAFAAAVHLDNDNPHYLYNYAVALDKLGRGRQATYYYRKFLRNSLDDPPAANVTRNDVVRRIAYLDLNPGASHVQDDSRDSGEESIVFPSETGIPAKQKSSANASPRRLNNAVAVYEFAPSSGMVSGETGFPGISSAADASVDVASDKKIGIIPKNEKE